MEEDCVLFVQYSGSDLQYSRWVALSRDIDGEYKIDLIGLIY